MDQPTYALDQTRRDGVLASLLERAKQRQWTVIAAHVRSNPVHVVIDADAGSAWEHSVVARS
jgi:hypothetical protein